MKNYAQAILQFTGYPLEPIVALQINKSYQSHTLAGSTIQPVTSEVSLGSSFIYKATDMDERWFSNYE